MQNEENIGKILIVDDDELVTKTLKLLLSSQSSHEIYTYNSPQSALDFLNDNEIDLIISDFLMPDINGIDFLSQAKKIKPSVTTILLTGYADKENAIKAINEVGIYKYLEKPWDNDELIITINNALERSKLIETVKIQKEIERLRNDFIATLTHDLRTPLLAAIQTLEFFLDGTMGEISEKQNKFLSAMLHSNQDMLGLVNALLEVYRFESGNFILNKEEFDFYGLVQKCSQEVASLLDKKNIKLTIDIPVGQKLFADKHEIRRVVMNFIGNAISHTQDAGSIILKTNIEDNSFEFSVIDDGCGIAEDDVKKLFNRFSQGTSKKRSTGTGLGLYLSRQIIEAHDGEIGVESELDKGSRFYFKLRG